jgi:hypothetical protein
MYETFLVGQRKNTATWRNFDVVDHKINIKFKQRVVLKGTNVEAGNRFYEFYRELFVCSVLMLFCSFDLWRFFTNIVAYTYFS